MTTTTTKPHEVDINLTQLKEEALQRVIDALDALQPALKAFEAFKAAEAILRGSTQQIAAEAEIHSNGNARNGRRPTHSPKGTARDIEESLRQFLATSTGELRTQDMFAALPARLKQVNQGTVYAAIKALVTAGDLRRHGAGIYSRGSGDVATGTNPGKTGGHNNGEYGSKALAVLAVLAEAHPAGLTNRQIFDAVTEKGVTFPKGKHAGPTQCAWTINALRDGGKIRSRGAGVERLNFLARPNVKVSKAK